MKKKMILNTGASLLAQLVAVVCGFVLPRLILEEFGSEINGLTQSIKQFLGVISFLDLGVGQVIRSALYRPLKERDHHALSAVIVSGSSFYEKLACILAVYTLILTLIYPLVIDVGYDWNFTAILIIAMGIGAFAQSYFGLVNDQVLHADQRGYVSFSLQIITNIINLVVCVMMIHLGCSIQWVKLGASLVYLIRPALINVYVRRRYAIDRRACCEGEPIAQKWSGVAQHFSAVVLDGTDAIVLTLCSTLSNVSVYSVYYMVITSLQQLYQSATAGIQSAVGVMWAGDDRSAQIRMFERVEPVLHFVTVFLFSCAGVLIVPFVRVYTKGLIDADYIQPLFAGLLVLAYGIRCLRTPYNIWILAAGHYKQTQSCHIIAAAMNLVLSVIAVWQWGLVGVAIGTLGAMVFQTTWMAWYNVRHLLQRPAGTVLKQFAVDALTAALIVAVCRWFTLNHVSYLGWMCLAVKIGCIALVITIAVAFLFYRNIFLRKTE